MEFADKPLLPIKQKIHNDALCKAIRKVMAGILGERTTEMPYMKNLTRVC